MNKAIAALLATTALVSNAFALDAEVFSLDNGMQVVLVEDHRAPVVINSVWYFAGSADEEKGVTGIAHMLEHMMFKGTDKIPAGEFSKIIARKGGQDNAFTSRDYTAYYQKIAKENLPTAVEMEADRIANLKINDEVFQPERDVVLEERRMRVENKPKYRFFEKLMKKAFPTHPYGNPVIGWREDIKNYKLEDATNWYGKHYTPNNSVLIMAGDITRDEVEPLIRSTYGRLEQKFDTPIRENWVEPKQKAPIVYEEKDPSIQVPMFYRLYRTPSMFEGIAGEFPKKKDIVALALLSSILGGDDTSHMYQKIVKEKHLADVAATDYDAVTRGEAVFDIYVEPKPGVTMKQIAQAVDDVLSDLQENGVSEEELKRARTAFLAQDVFGRDSVFRTVYMLGRWIISGGTVENFDEWQAIIKEITVEDVQRVATEYLTADLSTTGILTKGEK